MTRLRYGTGALVSAVVSYLGLPDTLGMSARYAAGYVSFYWGGAMISRFLGAPVSRRVQVGNGSRPNGERYRRA